MKRQCVVIAMLVAAGFIAGTVRAQETQKAAATTQARPAMELDQTDPQTGLASYLKARKGMDYAAIQKCIVCTDSTKKAFVDVLINYNMWSFYLERTAIAKFGPANGLTVLGHLRSVDTQITMDLKRVLEANITYSGNRDSADIYLRVERDRPEGLQASDQLNFLDHYVMIKQGSDWKVDYIKTYQCDDPEKEDTYKYQTEAYPKISKAMKEISAQIKDGTISNADSAKSILEAKQDNATPDGGNGGGDK